MHRDPLALLEDVEFHDAAILDFLGSAAIEDYRANRMMRSAVEREFTIIGEALSRLGKIDAPLLDSLDDAKTAIAFRNVLVHGYASLSDDRVFLTAGEPLRRLLASVRAAIDQRKSTR